MNKYTTKPVIIRGLFDTKTVKTIHEYLDEHIPLIPLASDLEEPESMTKFGRLYGHNLPPFVDIHNQLVDYASELFGERVKPSYAFLSMYQAGGQCPLHIDRPQCRYTIDYLIRQGGTEPWPIDIGPQMSDRERDSIIDTHPLTLTGRQFVIDTTEWTRVLLNPNDAVCYSGTNAWHYRPFGSKTYADLAFFHFVPEGFDGSLD